MNSTQFLSCAGRALCLAVCLGSFGIGAVRAQAADIVPVKVSDDTGMYDRARLGGRKASAQGMLFGGSFSARSQSTTDFTGDGMNDLVYFDPATAQWSVHNVADESTETFGFGVAGGKPVAADYDGDGVIDVAMVRQEGGLLCWELRYSTGGTASLDWGVNRDVPVKGDYDGDGRADLAVWRPSTGEWIVLASTTGELMMWQLDTEPSDVVTPGDYDGDGIADPAVFRLAETTFYYLSSRDGSLRIQGWEPTGEWRDLSLVPADYDGDRMTDFAVFTPHDGQYRILLSRTREFLSIRMPVNSSPCVRWEACDVRDFAQPADYDNDGVADPAIWTPKSGMVYAVGSQAGPVEVFTENTFDVRAVSAYFVK
jgi:hypothetical protein